MGETVTATIALGIPHTPWVPERAESHLRLMSSLAGQRGGLNISSNAFRTFTDREPNSVWSQKMWRWAVSTGATHFLQLQDDAIVAPNFWPALRAMLEAVPDQVIGLEAAHPLGPEMQRTGRRWYRTRAWLIGVGYVFPVEVLKEFLRWGEDNPGRIAVTNEDTLASQWACETGWDIWHPRGRVLLGVHGGWRAFAAWARNATLLALCDAGGEVDQRQDRGTNLRSVPCGHFGRNAVEVAVSDLYGVPFFELPHQDHRAEVVRCDDNNCRTRIEVRCTRCRKTWYGCLAKRLDDDGAEAWGPVGEWTWRQP